MLEALKRQCRVDFDDDDELLANCLDAAFDETVRLTGRIVSDLLELGDGQLPAPLRQAVLIRAAQFYSQPEGSDKPNMLYYSLIRNYQLI